MVMVSVVVADLPPLGVTVCGLKLQLASSGKPLHVKLTAESNPLPGVIVNVAVPLCPALIVSEVGFAETVMPGGGGDNLNTVPHILPLPPFQVVP